MIRALVITCVLFSALPAFGVTVREGSTWFVSAQNESLRPYEPQFPNTPAGDEMGAMPWVTRGVLVVPAAYHWKDRNQFNTLYPEQLMLHARQKTAHGSRMTPRRGRRAVCRLVVTLPPFSLV